MYYYTRNLGDYYKKAGRLTILQHGIYNLLIDACYDRERFPADIDEAIEWVWASSQEEIDGVKLVVNKFFKEGESGKLVQKRIAEEVRNYQELCDKNSRNGKKGGRPKKATGLNKKATGLNSEPKESDPLALESDLKPKPITNNHKPITKGKTKEKIARFVPPTFDEIKSRCETQNYKVNPSAFFSHYESNGWRVGKNKMKSWHAALSGWETRDNEKNKSNGSTAKATREQRASALRDFAAGN